MRWWGEADAGLTYGPDRQKGHAGKMQWRTGRKALLHHIHEGAGDLSGEKLLAGPLSIAMLKGFGQRMK